MGPCLCGDIYCSSCGNPAQAAVADAEQAFIDRLGEMQCSVTEYEFLLRTVPVWIQVQRDEVQHIVTIRDTERHAIEQEELLGWEGYPDGYDPIDSRMSTTEYECLRAITDAGEEQGYY